MIPQVNALATDRNREQTERIVKKLGYKYYPNDELDAQYRRDGSAIAWKSVEDNERLPNGSLAPCQVVAMLEAEGIGWFAGGSDYSGEWAKRQVKVPKDNEAIVETDDPHDLTPALAALDALIKVLETKGEKK